jgi:Leucine-rich repeat (LRR) protein
MLSNLQELKLSSRQFPNQDLTGPLPTEYFVVQQSMHNNNKTNVNSAAFPKLHTLWLANTKVTATIPTEMALLSSSLKHLRFGNNEMSGTVPSELGKLTKLVELGLTASNLTSTIPSELGELTTLQHLRLGNNHLSGTIPIELSHLTNLKVLRLESNRDLQGLIPDAFCGIPELTFGCGDDDSLTVMGTTDLCGCDCPCI